VRLFFFVYTYCKNVGAPSGDGIYFLRFKLDFHARKGDVEKAPVKSGMVQEVKVFYRGRASNPLLRQAQYRCFDKLSTGLASSYAATIGDGWMRSVQESRNFRFWWH
jgi:hypothetical protein